MTPSLLLGQNPQIFLFFFEDPNSKKQRKNMLKKLKDDPIKMGGSELPKTTIDTYFREGFKKKF